MSIHKNYDPVLDNEYGLPAEKAIINYLKQKDIEVKHFPFGKYDVDISFTIGTVTYYADIERRKNWKDSDEFPYWLDPLHIPERKLKMIKERTPFFYFVVRDDLKRVAILSGESISSGELIYKHENRLFKTGDSMIGVPLSEIIKYGKL